jgi:hypothetical protein
MTVNFPRKAQHHIGYMVITRGVVFNAGQKVKKFDYGMGCDTL